MARFSTASIATVGALAMLLAGCLERKETIRVHPDGAADVRLEFRGDVGDFSGGDALPSEESGWNVTSENLKSENKEERVLRADRTVKAGEDLPDSYAVSGDPEHEAALRFPGHVRVEKREDGTYYHFFREYQSREHQRFEHAKKLLGAEEKLGGLEGDPAEMSDEQRATLLELLRGLEAHKRSEFVMAAARSIEEWPQDYALRLRAALLDEFDRAPLEPLLALLSQEQSGARDERIDDIANDLFKDVDQRLDAELTELGVSRQQREKFEAAMDLQEARRAATEDIGDERFEVRIELPGEVILHNGKLSDDGFVTWEFDGQALYDRSELLMATSRVERR